MLRYSIPTALAITIIVLLTGSVAAQSSRAMSFQGRLTDDSGAPLSDTVSLTFRLYDTETEGTAVWTQVHPEVGVTNGLFHVMLSEFTDAASVFDGTSKWLSIQVESDPEISPRSQIGTVAYAYRSTMSDTATYALASPTGTAGGWTDDATTVRLASAGDSIGIGVTDPSEQVEMSGNLRVGGKIIAGGTLNDCSGDLGFIGGGDSCIITGDATYSTVSGGRRNVINADYSMIGGGWENDIGLWGANEPAGNGIASGINNSVQYCDSGAFIGGGQENMVQGDWAIVGGGRKNRSEGDYCTVAGGFDNRVTFTDNFSTIGGGDSSYVSATCATIGGGHRNNISGDYGTVGGGELNLAQRSHATVAGGRSNNVIGTFGFIGGGDDNAIHGEGHWSAIAGGLDNFAYGPYAFVGGGYSNYVGTGEYTTIAGGYENQSYGSYSTVPGGAYNHADGNYSFAAGSYARADHNHSFVWSDGYNLSTFETTGSYQFLIRAHNGVGINGNTPMGALDITQDPDQVCLHFSNGSRDITWMPTHALQFGQWNDTTWTERMRISSDGYVGIGVTNPTYRLDCSGSIRCVSVNETSDGRYKHSVSQIDNALETVESMRGVTFEWNDEIEAKPGRQVGVIAQEVEEVLPEVVSTDAEGIKSVDYSKLTAVLIEAVKELKAENEDLRDRVNKLESEM